MKGDERTGRTRGGRGYEDQEQWRRNERGANEMNEGEMDERGGERTNEGENERTKKGQ